MKKFNMADLVADTVAGRSQPLPQRSTAQRTRAFPRDPLPTRQQREEARTQAHQHRAYAEAWYQALRGWDVVIPVPHIPKVSYGPGGSFDVSTLGEFLPDAPTALITPTGQLREVEVGRMITDMENSPVPDRQALGALLGSVRKGDGPASLLREDGGWGTAAPRKAAYAVAVLTLAVAMGDGMAEGPLRYAAAVMQRGEGL